MGLRDKVECPVCLDVPKKAPIPVCPNGHVVCSKCVREKCPTCRVKMEQGKSSLAVTVIENIDHDCENEGCNEKLSHRELVSHDKSCFYRLVECPDLESCKEKISLASLGMGNGKCDSTWKLESMRFDEHIFLLKVVA